MWISKTGVQAQDAKLQAIANNLANVNTVGFKRDRVMYEDLFYQVERQPGAQRDDATNSPTGVMLGNGTRVAGTQKVFTTGSLQTTSQALDVAIVGNGFLQVQMANATDITIAENGIVSVTVSGSTTSTQLGQLTLAGFINPAGLLALGDNLYQETEASGAPTEGVPGEDALGKIKQGALEGSNVQVVEEMVDMIAAQRTYEMNTKVLSAADNMLQALAQAVR
ncbi:MAG: flagellar basal body rod protein FlgG [Candidatus Dactylopiibacterium carminicum]|uniref:Flagellar basal body rod protein FlgG n=2 Tax=Candidatus Dactylopiibacterium carminicum TaxID=857335 RepID=A0A272EWN1_9RHOO|nr:flagellar basal body rod protein FlgG [Candidatus Dactylopiibacterium carminicum]PAS94466.1 MAG: flagellar basal body rod protein FlgG [Candidatus Dactylopiibacterium carminicum]PAS97048.1 MAG: flagellar basal body rod protein FlgG [Candidatus Dactylopiibacterium carminicum]PAS99955.1 MAG: flagellar basal body rod protein FlgG [Candidatus Dactylopiibacterium carminicum]